MDSNLPAVGRPALTQEQIDDVFHKLEPHLRTGLSLYKACLEAKIASSTVYEIYKRNEQFMERVEAVKNYRQVLLNDIVTKELVRIQSKATNLLPLEANEVKFIQSLMLHQTEIKDTLEERFKAEEDKQERFRLGNTRPSEFDEFFDKIIAESNANIAKSQQSQESQIPSPVAS